MFATTLNYVQQTVVCGTFFQRQGQSLGNVACRYSVKTSIHPAGLVGKWDTNLHRLIRQSVDFVANSVQMDKVS